MSYKLTHEAIHASNCSGLPKSVLIVLADYASEDGECYPAQETIAELLGCNRRSVLRAIEQLETLGILTRDGWRNRARKYRINLPKTDDEAGATCDTGSQVLATQGLKSPNDMRHRVSSQPTTCDTGSQVLVTQGLTNISLNRPVISPSPLTPPTAEGGMAVRMKRNPPPTLEEVTLKAKQLNIPVKYAAMFFEEKAANNWVFVDKHGNDVYIHKYNYAGILSGWWRWKKRQLQETAKATEEKPNLEAMRKKIMADKLNADNGGGEA